MSYRSYTLENFEEALGAKSSVPGGGGAAGYAAALSADLGRMVIAFTVGKKTYAEWEDTLLDCRRRLRDLGQRALDSIDRDAEVFEPLSRAYGLPKTTPEEEEKRRAVLEVCLLEAASSPLELLRLCDELTGALEEAAAHGSRLMRSDAGCAAALCRASMTCALMNVYINTRLMTNREKAEAMNREAEALAEKNDRRLAAVSDRITEELKK